MDKTIGNRISLQLDKKGMMQKELAKRTGLTPVSISRYIKGIREPKIETAAKIADVLGCSVNYLLGTEVDTPKETSKADDPEGDFYKALRLVAKSSDKWSKKQKAEIVNALMGVT